MEERKSNLEEDLNFKLVGLYLIVEEGNRFNKKGKIHLTDNKKNYFEPVKVLLVGDGYLERDNKFLNEKIKPGDYVYLNPSTLHNQVIPITFNRELGIQLTMDMDAYSRTNGQVIPDMENYKLRLVSYSNIIGIKKQEGLVDLVKLSK
ncbi:MAG: hypothetical protein HC917_18195 [Richelia sp. SM2_1_7]|nr:hypothetical protein [Richelia sp. SM2_1_7]